MSTTAPPNPTNPERPVRKALWKTARSSGRVVRRMLLGTPTPPTPLGLEPGERVDAEVAVYFPDGVRRLYQLAQWLPVLEKLDQRRSVVLVLRRRAAFEALAEATSLRRVYVPLFPHLTAFYEAGAMKVAVYVNNSVRNFQSLAFPRMLHVHVNHGESDKVSMVSNQAKAYDRVFVAGDAAIERHRVALLAFDESRLVPVGRPQLDLVSSDDDPVAAHPGYRTVLYAPTWEGENDANNYTSVDLYGPQIVEAILAMPQTRLVYKPHPRVPTSSQPEVAAGHARIMELIGNAATADPAAGHEARLEGDILPLLRRCDLMVSDVSSVALDFLYLATERPILITDRRDDHARLLSDAPVSRAADVINSETIASLPQVLHDRLELGKDEHRAERATLRRFYFGDLAVGESTQRFLDAVDQLIAERDHLVKGRPWVAVSAEATEE